MISLQPQQIVTPEDVEELIRLAEKVYQHIETMRSRMLRIVLASYGLFFLVASLLVVAAPLAKELHDAVVILGVVAALVPLVGFSVLFSNARRKMRIEEAVLHRLMVMIDEVKESALLGTTPVHRALIEMRLTRIDMGRAPLGKNDILFLERAPLVGDVVRMLGMSSRLSDREK
ncbi:hypothetical protein [Nannocystis sp. SCPEA4]|uniref:hypothetical protein n=1 Tax=Nannocystis sp. SCPEA4 TaxID=2996787 RepID=UPI0022710D29|nr:hypothetical protein [Nannocystis sp. SCPEA4]MCY1054495.1 hypothetical protein [Nannocystis sp. SCPEA4]